MTSGNAAFDSRILDLPLPKEIVLGRSLCGHIIWEACDSQRAVLCHISIPGLHPPINPRTLYGKNLPNDADRISFYMKLFEDALEREARDRVGDLT